MSRIFISYRRDDSGGYALLLYDRLSQHFGKDNVFMDIDTIEPGLDFVEVIEAAVGSCDVLIALIGRQWLTITDARGQRRLDNPEDFVRLEIKTALDRNIRVIPALTPGATMPRSEELPDALKRLARRNAITISPRFHPEVTWLIEVVEKVLTTAKAGPPAEVASAEPPQPKPSPPRPKEPVLAGKPQTDYQPQLKEPGTPLTRAEWKKMKDEQAKARPATLADLKPAGERAVPAVVPHVPYQLESKPSAPKLPKILTPRQPFEPELILIPAGEFLMGSDPQKDKQAYKDEQPQHRLYLPDYYIAKTPVTNAQYRAFVQATGHDVPKHWKGKEAPPGKENHPVVYVPWDDAVAYCRWLAEVTGKPYRLPTEAEWEKAARGSDGRLYPWGNEWDARRCNTGKGGRKDTTPVGTYPSGASPYGVLDMAGNVWEWCATEWGKRYPYDATQDEWTDDYLKGDNGRVLRGGAFYNDQYLARCAFRDGYEPDDWNYGFGFRLVVSPIL